METSIKKLKKGDVFIYDGIKYSVTKRYVDDDHPLIALDDKLQEHLFHYDDLLVTKLD